MANHPLELKGNSDVLVMTRPDVILDIHRLYLEAGCDIIETNTFSSQAISQADYDLQDLSYEMNVAGARLARQACDEFTAKTPDQPRFVAGSIGPTNRTLSLSPDMNDPSARAVTFDQMRDAYRDQIRGLIDGGSDTLLFETITDTLNAKAALVACEEVFDEKGVRLPIMISVTVTDRSGRTLSGQTVEAFWISIAHAKPFSVGINCALGARDMAPYIEELARHRHDADQLLSECGIAQRVRRLRRAAGGDGRPAPRLCRARLAEHRRRLLRHHAGAHRRDPRGGQGLPARADAQAKAWAYDSTVVAHLGPSTAA